MKLHYDSELLVSSSSGPKSDIFSDISTQIVFIALLSNTISFWVLCKTNAIHFRQKEIKDENAAAYFQHLMENVERVIHSLDEPRGSDAPFKEECGQENEEASQGKENPLRLLYDTVIGPIADLLPGDELVIVPDGPLCMSPYASFLDHDSRYLCESFRIRIFPSLTCLRLITDCPEGYHKKAGHCSWEIHVWRKVSTMANLPTASYQAPEGKLRSLVKL